MDRLRHRRTAILMACSFGFLLLPCRAAPAQQSGTIGLQGTIASTCSIAVSSLPSALQLDLSGGPAQHVAVGTVVQTCNKLAGYKLTVSSVSCSLGSDGAKLIGVLAGDTVPYSVEFDNPPTGGSGNPVVNLLASACAGDAATLGRSVSHAKIAGETSTIFVNYHATGGLGTDLYRDMLTITMTVN